MERYRAIANPDEPDPSFSVPCRRCAELLQEGNRFCPFCFEDQLAPAGAAPLACAQVDIGINGETPPPPEGFDFMDTVQPDAKGIVPIAYPADATGHALAASERGLLQPGPYWQTQVLEASGKAHWAARFAAPPRLVLGIASGLVLLMAAVLGLQRGFEARHAADGLQAFKVEVDRVQVALNRGDLSGAGQMLDLLEVDHADDPGVQALREALDLRVQEQSARRVPPEPQAPAADPAPAIAKAPAGDTACSEVLAALALCSQK